MRHIDCQTKGNGNNWHEDGESRWNFEKYHYSIILWELVKATKHHFLYRVYSYHSIYMKLFLLIVEVHSTEGSYVDYQQQQTNHHSYLHLVVMVISWYPVSTTHLTHSITMFWPLSSTFAWILFLLSVALSTLVISQGTIAHKCTASLTRPIFWWSPKHGHRWSCKAAIAIVPINSCHYVSPSSTALPPCNCQHCQHSLADCWFGVRDKQSFYPYDEPPALLALTK